jgi:Lar family restriction alleviation protein
VTEELKPCPFCGSHGEELGVGVEDPEAPRGWQGWFVRCYVCHVETCREGLHALAVEKWNTRAAASLADTGEVK